MLPKENRLKGAKSFDKVKSEGKVIQSKNFGLAMLNRKDKGPARFGIIVSTKISKKAVLRNKIKRVIRESLRGMLEKIKPGFDIVFLVKKKIKDEDSDRIEEEILSAFKKGDLFN